MSILISVPILCISSIQSLNRVRLFATPWTVAHQAPLSMEFSREAYWSGLPCPPPGDLPDPGIKPSCPALQANSLPSEPPGKPHKCFAAAAAAKSLQSCPTLCDPIDGSPPGSSVLGFSRQEHWSGLPFPSPTKWFTDVQLHLILQVTSEGVMIASI